MLQADLMQMCELLTVGYLAQNQQKMVRVWGEEVKRARIQATHGETVT